MPSEKDRLAREKRKREWRDTRAQRPNPPRPRGGRPPKVVDWGVVENLCSIQCTKSEIANIIGVSEVTLSKKCREDKGLPWLEWSGKYREGGKASLRRAQWLKAIDEGDTRMQIWLGKQLLGQSDKVESKQEVVDLTPDRLREIRERGVKALQRLNELPAEAEWVKEEGE